MSGRYKAVPETTNNRRLVYVVIDTITGEWMHVYDCFLWAEHKAEEMNKEWSPCTTCAFSEKMGKDFGADRIELTFTDHIGRTKHEQT